MPLYWASYLLYVQIISLRNPHKTKALCAPTTKCVTLVLSGPTMDYQLMSRVRASIGIRVPTSKVSNDILIMRFKFWTKTKERASIGIKTKVRASIGIKTKVRASVCIKTKVQANIGIKTKVRASIGIKTKKRASVSIKTKVRARISIKTKVWASMGIRTKIQQAEGPTHAFAQLNV